MLLGAAGLSMTSCSDSFLDEEQKNAFDTDYFNTKEGIDSEITGAYSALGWRYNYSWGYGLYNMGVDEYTDANNEVAAMNGYTTMTSTEGTYVPGLWDNMYNRIEAVNNVLAKISSVYPSNDANFNVRKGEALFLRAFCYFDLVKTYGAVPVKLTPSSGVQTNFVRNTEEECFKQIIDDFTASVDLLPEEAPKAEPGRITKYAAMHYLAKAKLTRASELYAGWNSQYVDADLNSVVELTEKVVAKHPLCDDFVSLWNYTKPNDANEYVSEVVLAAQFTYDEATQGRFGNQAHLCFPSVYQNMAGCSRDISGGREFCYTRTTNYTLDVFDRVNDSRFWKTFITCYGANNNNGPRYTQAMVDAGIVDAATANIHKNDKGEDEGNLRFKDGEIGIRYIINNAGDTEYEEPINPADGKPFGEAVVTRNGQIQVPHTFVRYFAGQEQNWVTGHGNYGNYAQKARFVANSKHRDGSRNTIASQFGNRDALIARSAEDVLMRAEAFVRLKKYDKAITEINKLRNRAGYYEGELRDVHVDGGAAYKNCFGTGLKGVGAIYTEANTYYESNKMEGQETTAETKTALLINSIDDILNSAIDNRIYEAVKATGGEMFKGDETYVKMMNFILNERTREMTGEYNRWEDLARMRQIEARHKAFNDAGVRNQGTFDPAKHYYRPIPQAFLNSLTSENGVNLTTEQKAAWQNPGF